LRTGISKSGAVETDFNQGKEVFFGHES